MRPESIRRSLCVLAAVPVLLVAGSMPAAAGYFWTDFNPWFDFSSGGLSFYFNPLEIWHMEFPFAP